MAPPDSRPAFKAVNETNPADCPRSVPLTARSRPPVWRNNSREEVDDYQKCWISHDKFLSFDVSYRTFCFWPSPPPGIPGFFGADTERTASVYQMSKPYRVRFCLFCRYNIELPCRCPISDTIDDGSRAFRVTRQNQICTAVIHEKKKTQKKRNTTKLLKSKTEEMENSRHVEVEHYQYTQYSS